MAHMRTSVLGPTALRTVSTYDSAKRRDLARDLADRIVVLDSSTGIHHAHCARIAGQVARAVHLTRLDSRRLVLGAMLHDLGKIGIDEAVWNHPNGLSPEQRRIMQRHSQIGEMILRCVPELADLAPLVRSHHERWDGTGYPDGLVGNAIPYLARIIALIDAYEAMTAQRPYRPSLSPTQALWEICRCQDSQFDPALADAFCAAIRWSRNGDRPPSPPD